MNDDETPPPERIPSPLEAQDAATTETCRTLPYLASFSKCLSNKPDCKYSRPFGYCKFCVHPEHQKFWTGNGDGI